jgi:hypothetical protein
MAFEPVPEDYQFSSFYASLFWESAAGSPPHIFGQLCNDGMGWAFRL